jgi:hypothetical protein
VWLTTLVDVCGSGAFSCSFVLLLACLFFIIAAAQYCTTVGTLSTGCDTGLGALFTNFVVG